MPTTLEHDHSHEGIRRRLAEENRPNYVRDFVYGGIDGAVTTFAVVAGVSGAELAPKIVIILGVANLIADGFSMAASNYSGTKTELDDLERVRAIEAKHVRLAPEGEREEVRQIMAGKGLSGDSLEEAVHAITSDDKVWIDFMLMEEYGLTTTLRSPLKSALSTFAAFVLCGAVPLVAYVFKFPNAFEWATALTAATFFGIGSARSIWSLHSWWRAGLETMAIGLAAAGTAYFVGYMLAGIGG